MRPCAARCSSAACLSWGPYGLRPPPFSTCWWEITTSTPRERRSCEHTCRYSFGDCEAEAHGGEKKTHSFVELLQQRFQTLSLKPTISIPEWLFQWFPLLLPDRNTMSPCWHGLFPRQIIQPDKVMSTFFFCPSLVKLSFAQALWTYITSGGLTFENNLFNAAQHSENHYIWRKVTLKGDFLVRVSENFFQSSIHNFLSNGDTN